MALFNLTYTKVKGTTPDGASAGGIDLNCDDGVPCANLAFKDVNIASTSNKVLQPRINDAFGTTAGTILPSLSGLPSGPPGGSLMTALQKQAAICG